MNKGQIGRLVTLHAVTSFHPGTGQTTGVVDLPVQREVHTGFPMMASSGFKGSLRDKAEREWASQNDVVVAVFGSDDAKVAGALAVTDLRILAFPVRSLQKVFLWVTCPMVLDRLHRDMCLAGITVAGWPATTPTPGDDGALVAEGSGLADGPLVLEEIALQPAVEKPTADKNEQAIGAAIASLVPATVAAKDFAARLVVVGNEEFQHLVRHGTQVSARIKLNENKTTTGDGGNLWYEETLPPETVMYGLFIANSPRDEGRAKLQGEAGVMTKVENLVNGQFLQVGGNETVGQGWCGVKVHGGAQ